MEALFNMLYPVAGFVVMYAYVPQITALLKAEKRSEDMALGSWLMWLIAAIITFGYSVFCIGDLRLSLVTGCGCLLNMTVTSLLIYNRYIRFGDPEAAARYLRFDVPVRYVPAAVRVFKNAKRSG